MLGRADIDYDELLTQLDSSTGDYAELGLQTRGFKGATRNYRKIQDLELHPVFKRYAELPLFREICTRIYGDAPIACYRAMFMNKPGNAGTQLPWHQDRWTNLDRDPLVTIWTALDDATADKGCLDVIPGSHKQGVRNRDHPSAFLSASQVTLADDEPHELLEVEAGEVLLLHNWLLHRSGVNHQGAARGAFSVCYMDARTEVRGGEVFRPLFQH